MVENLGHISEDAIKRAALGFLKTYYKFRPRSGETKISTDNIHPSGIVADGFLEFPDENNKLFTATFEATSDDKIDEVKFTTHYNDLIWDSVVFASFSTLIILFVLWKFNILSLSISGLLVCSLFTILSLCALAFSYFQLKKSSSKYRYIYAIEQFKQYHADEQWIALSNTAFDSVEDKNYLELKSQCIKNGIGMFMVSDEEQIDLKLTPAREEVFHNNRKKIHFSHLNFNAAFNNTDYSRFSHQHYSQIIMSFGSLALIGSLFYGQFIQSNNNKIYFPEDRLKELEYKGSLPPETKDVFVSEKNQIPIRSENNSVKQNKNKSDVGLYVFVPGANYVLYPCERVNIKGNKFIVEESEFPTFEEAKKRIEYLSQFELVANCISMNCLKRPTKGYLVYFEFIYNKEEDANFRYEVIRKQFQSANLPLNNLKTRMLIF